MSRNLLRILTIVALAVSQPAAAQIATTKEIPTRIELHVVKSLWISDEQFLKGDTGGKEVLIGMELRVAQGAGKHPTVILMHGSGGIGANVPFWQRELNAIGINTLTIDGMTGRGLQGVGTNQAILGRLNLILDIYRSLDVLAKHPRVDVNRIALMGFSRGGQAALYASLARFHKQWNTSGIEIQAYIPFYPDCATTYQGDTDTVDKPIRIFHGTPDNYNPIATCKSYMARLKDAKRDIALTEYPNAPHGFDNPIAPTKAFEAKDNQSVRDCKIQELEPGKLVNTETKAIFTFQDACVRLHPLVGADKEAGAASLKEISTFLKGTFKMN
ncbi:MAG: dienelactone hydrolase family protein [Hyphomicrobiaceae bacterium]